MPKRHRQPEPVTALKAGRQEVAKSSTAQKKTVKTAASTADSIASSSTSAMLPQSPVLTEPAGPATSSSGTPDSQVSSEAMSYDSSQVGDDGNQDYYGSHSDEDLSVSSSEQDDMRAMRRAVRANRVAVASRRKVSNLSAGTSSSSSDSDLDSAASEEERRVIADEAPFDLNERIVQLTTSSDDENDEENDDDDDTDGSQSDVDDSDSDEEMSIDEEHGIYESDEEEDNDEEEEDADMSDEEGHDGGDDDDDDSSDREDVTVDFGVYDMEKKHTDAVMHLMDQLCPDHMNEVDRDDLGAAFAENPFTYIVKVGDNDEDQSGSAKPDDEEEEELYGLASVLDVAHGLQRHPAAFRPLQTLLKEQVWRTVHPGLPPTDILTTMTDDKAKRAKCGLLVGEYIRNVPVELSVQILEDLVQRLQTAPSKKASADTPAEGKSDASVRLTVPCMFAVLAKVQRAVDAPVTLVKKSSKKVKEAQAAASSEGAKDEKLDLDAYIFWREEDRVLYRFRDTRVATYAYRCRPQYDGQPEQEIPLSLLFVLQHGAAIQAIEEIKKKDLTKTQVTRYT